MGYCQSKAGIKCRLLLRFFAVAHQLADLRLRGTYYRIKTMNGWVLI